MRMAASLAPGYGGPRFTNSRDHGAGTSVCKAVRGEVGGGRGRRDRSAFEPLTVDVFDDADDGDPVVVRASRVESFDSSANGVFARPVPSGHGFVDEHDRRRVPVIRVLEESTLTSGTPSALK